MTPDDIKQLLDLVREHDLTEFEVERPDFKLRVKKGSTHVVTHVTQAAAPMGLPVAMPAGTAPAAPALAPAAAQAAAEAEEGPELAIVKSPIVGTFYRSAEPGAKAFVEVGDTVRKGQVLCIIEAMKLMNEIDSEYDGEIANIYVENGQPVQYGERLFAIRLRR
jgi:acetyl-CoA carboxylase biotin carboxyl carrier protein